MTYIEQLAVNMIERAIDLLSDKSKWSRTECLDKHGNFCSGSSDHCVKWTLIGAMSAGRLYYDFKMNLPYEETAEAHHIVYKEVLRVICDLHPKFAAQATQGGVVTAFNQDFDRTYSEVVEVLHVAHASLTKTGQRNRMQFDHATEQVQL